MDRKKIIVLLVSVILLVGVFVVIGAAVTSTTVANTETNTKTEADITADNAKGSNTSTSSERTAAEELIDQTVSREEVQTAVGEWEKFEMSSAGCERGVYAGRFYYEDFTIFSRTYDKGDTFRIISINE